METEKSISDQPYTVINDLPETPTENIGRTFDLLYKPGYAVEMRVFGLRRGDVASGYYDERDAFVRDVLQQDTTGKDTCYVTLNPVNPDLLARSCNTLSRCDGTKDKNVQRFRLLLIDFGPKRETGIPSTDDEKRAAYERLLEARAHLLRLGFPEPVIADSANGYHLLFRADLPTGDARLVSRFLEALNERFGDKVVGIDTSVHNPSRITKVYGTPPRNKSTGTKDRPVRASRLLDVPRELRTVGRDLLVSVAGEEEPQPRGDEPKGYLLRGGGKFDVEGFIERHGINVLKEDTCDGLNDWHGSKKWLVECPWNEHTDNSCHIIQNPEGVLSARCKHDSCQGKDWRDFRSYFEPGAYGTVSPSLKDRDTGATSVTGLEYQKITVVDVGKFTRPQGSQP